MVLNLPIKVIRRDLRGSASLNDEKVRQISESMRRGEPITPVKVLYDGANYWLRDGSHRVAAALSLGRETIEAEMGHGNLADVRNENEISEQGHLREHHG